MKKQVKVIMLLIAIIMLLQPLMVTISFAVETEEIIIQQDGTVTIIISDDALYEALKKSEGLKDKAEFYVEEEKNTIKVDKEDLNSIKELELSNSKISDLSGIEAFTGLVELSLSGNNLTVDSSLDKLNNLTNLEKLDLSRNKIEDLSSISSLLNKSGLTLRLDQDVKTVGFVSIIPDPEEYEDAENILLNEIREEIELPQILTAYENMNINIAEIKVEGQKVNSKNYSKYVEIKDGKVKILDRDLNKIEINLLLEGDCPTNGTTVAVKAYRIDTENQKGIYFKDENLYTAIKEKYEYAIGTKTKDFITSHYDEWRQYTFSGTSGDEWIFDDENFIVIANIKELIKITTITIENLEIKDLTGLEQFVGIAGLVLDNDSIINVSKVKELNDNKQSTIEEFLKKYDVIKAKLAEQVNTYNSYENQIQSIEKEIEELRKAIANETEPTDHEKTDEKEEKIEVLENKEEAVVVKIKYYIEKIEELCGNKTLAYLMTSPSVRDEIEELKNKNTEINSDFNLQIDAIRNNKLTDIASKVNQILNNITEAEIEELANVRLDGNAVITNSEKEKAEAKVAIQHMKDYIDTVLDTNISTVITEINDLTGSEVSKKDSSGNTKELSKIKNELKSALDRYQDSKNGIKDSDVIATCKKLTSITEEELLIKAKDNIIPTIQSNISSYAEDVNKLLIEEQEKIVTKYAWDPKTVNSELQSVISNLYSYMEQFNNMLNKLSVALSAEKYLTNSDDLLRVADRLQNLTEEDKKACVKLADLTYVEMENNSIKSIDELAEIETLETLKLAHNLIENVEFSKFKKLKSFYLSYNCLSEITISDTVDFTLLDLSDNWISKVDSINLSNMPSLKNLYLDGNKIADIESLLKQNNSYLKGLGYNNLGDYISAGGDEFKLTGQVLELHLTVHTTDSKVEIELPKIFRQIKNLQSNDFSVNIYRENPCLGVYGDGTKAILDTSLKNIQQQAIATLNVGVGNSTICKINYIAVKDETAPTIEKVTITPDKWNNENVTVKVEGANDDGTGLAVRAYSFDNGTTWQTSNEKVFTENTANVIIKVKDVAGNIYTHETINITNIDKIKPVITVNSKVIDTETGKASVTVSIKEDDSKLSEENKYEYYLSTSKDEQKDGQWITYTPDTAFDIGEEKEGTYYLFVKSVKDNANNESDIPEVTEFTFKKVDKIAPTIDSVTGITDVETKENVVLTIVGAKDDVALDDEPYSFDGGLTWQASNTKEYESNTENIQIIVRDAAGNKYIHEKLNITNIKKEETKPDEGNQTEEKADYLTLNGITKIVYAYINNDCSNLSEASKLLAGDDGVFSLSEVTALIRLYLSI